MKRAAKFLGAVLVALGTMNVWYRWWTSRQEIQAHWPEPDDGIQVDTGLYRDFFQP